MNVIFAVSSSRNLPVCNLDIEGVDNLILSFDKSLDEVSDFLKILNINFSLLDDKYEKMRTLLGMSYQELFYAIPLKSIEVMLQNASEVIRNAVEDNENKVYLVTYLTIKRFLRSLSVPLIDKKILEELCKETKHIQVLSRIKEFFPDATGHSKKTEYSMVGTATGRLTVESGPQILTLNASARKALKSRFDKGKVLQIDLSAAEPSIALKAIGQKDLSFEKDIYEHLSVEILGNKVSREISKLVTLCVLYGQSSKNLEKKLPDDVSSSFVIRKTREFFNISQLEKILYDKFREKSFRNILGRPINLKNDNLRLCTNYYLQSSAAELSILLFSEWSKKNLENIVPLYVIHDALILDCKKNFANELLNKQSIYLKLGDWTFKAKVTQVSDI